MTGVQTCALPISLFRAYLRWLHTQGLSTPHWNKKDYDGWLVKVGRMQAYREPGVTCLTSLGKGIMGTLENPINDSKGCGGMVRVMPVGLVEDEERTFSVGMRSAAITHGASSVYLSSAALALIVHYLVEGYELEEAILKAIAYVKGEAQSEEVVMALENAIALAQQGEPTHEKIEGLGKGFIAEEALAMAVYAALSYPKDFEAAIRLAVNHSGDSDSVGAITGGL